MAMLLGSSYISDLIYEAYSKVGYTDAQAKLMRDSLFFQYRAPEEESTTVRFSVNPTTVDSQFGPFVADTDQFDLSLFGEIQSDGVMAPSNGHTTVASFASGALGISFSEDTGLSLSGTMSGENAELVITSDGTGLFKEGTFNIPIYRSNPGTISLGDTITISQADTPLDLSRRPNFYDYTPFSTELSSIPLGPAPILDLQRIISKVAFKVSYSTTLNTTNYNNHLVTINSGSIPVNNNSLILHGSEVVYNGPTIEGVGEYSGLRTAYDEAYVGPYENVLILNLSNLNEQSSGLFFLPYNDWTEFKLSDLAANVVSLNELLRVTDLVAITYPQGDTSNIGPITTESGVVLLED